MAIIKGKSDAEYNQVEGARSSILSTIDRETLAHAKWAIDNEVNSEPFKFGRAAHEFFLSPGSFVQKWGIFPEGHNGTTKEGKKVKQELTDVYGLNLLKADEYMMLVNMQSRCMENPTISALLKSITDTELTLTWKDDGIDCKAKIDAVCNIKGQTVLIDLKTARDASPRAFENSTVNYGYLIQSAHYLRGAKANGLIEANNNNFLHVVLEKEAPFLSAVYCIDDASLELAEIKRMEALKKYNCAMQVNQWPGYSEDIVTVAAPHWYFQQQETFYEQESIND